MPKAALYARYSSDLQNPQSIEDQIRDCRQYAARKGWEVTEIYNDEAISGAAVRSRAGMLQLLEDARDGRFDILCAEALDRISRDQEDVAHVYKRLCFERITLNTVAEGQVNEMHIGLKGTMNALFLKDLAEKTRRGQRGRVEKGRSGGGLAYGYDVVLADESGGAGARMINEDQARVVRRIFRDFAEGMAPGAISDALNREGVPGPGGRGWKPTTIRGHRMRGTGIINNELYRGVLVWNRQSFVKAPATGKRQARMNPEAEWIRKDVPELRIIDEDLWLAVKPVRTRRKEPVSMSAPGSGRQNRPGLRECLPQSSFFTGCWSVSNVAATSAMSDGIVMVARAISSARPAIIAAPSRSGRSRGNPPRFNGVLP